MTGRFALNGAPAPTPRGNAMEAASALRSFADLVPPLFSRATSSQAYNDNMGLGGDLDIAALYSHRQKLAIQYAAIATSAVSVLTCLISLYWFTLMRRNFRRTLILLLIISDLFKSAWYLIFPAVSVAVGGIPSYSPFCNVGGFFLQAGVESCGMQWPVNSCARTLTRVRCGNSVHGRTHGSADFPFRQQDIRS